MMIAFELDPYRVKPIESFVVRSLENTEALASREAGSKLLVAGLGQDLNGRATTLSPVICYFW